MDVDEAGRDQHPRRVEAFGLDRGAGRQEVDDDAVAHQHVARDRLGSRAVGDETSGDQNCGGHAVLRLRSGFDHSAARSPAHIRSAATSVMVRPATTA